jgi:hypothetical protein
MHLPPTEPSSTGLVARVVSAVLAAPDDELLAPTIVPPPIPIGLSPRQQLFAYIMACGAPSIKALGALIVRTAFAILLLVIAGLLAWGRW